jgi:ankyrin repeat protein
VVSLLLKLGINCEVKDFEGNKADDIARKMGFEEIANGIVTH